MEKVGYLSKIDACSIMAKKVNEIVDWINERDKDNKLTMQEVIRLWDEDIKREARRKAERQARGEESVNRR